MKKTARKSLYTGQLQGCNAVHIMSGLVALALAATQFSPLELANQNLVDYRSLNAIHLVTGAVGIFMVKKNYGSIAAKALYNVSIVLGIFTACFYIDTIISVVAQYNEIREIASKDGGELDGYVQDENYYIGKIAVCAIMIALGIIETLVGFVSDTLLDRLATHYSQNYTTLGQQQQLRRNRSRLTLMASVKLLLSLVTIGAGSYLEYLYKKTLKLKFLAWSMENLTGGFVCCAAIVELFALYSRKHNLLNLKVGLVLSTASAVMSLKTLDYMISFMFRNDLEGYRTHKKLGDSATIQGESFVKLLVHSAVIVLLAMSFFLCIFSAVEIGSCIERSYGNGAEKVDRKIHRMRNCFGVFHGLFGCLLLALCILSFTSTENYSKSYDGAPMLFIGLILFAIATTTAGQIRTLTTSSFVLAVNASMITLEYLCISINWLVQATISSHSTQAEHLGAVVLYGCQTTVLLAAFVTSLVHTIRFGSVIRKLNPNAAGSDSVLRTLGLSHLFYAVVCTAITGLAQAVESSEDSIPSKQQFTRMIHGPLAFAKFLIVLCASKQLHSLLPATILQIVGGSVVFVAVPVCTSSLYYFYAMLKDDLGGLVSESEAQTRNIYLKTALGLSALSVATCLIEYCASVASALRSSYLLHHRVAQPTPRPPNLNKPRPVSTLGVPTRGVNPKPMTAHEWSGESPYYYYKHAYANPYETKPQRTDSYAQTYIRHSFQNGYPAGTFG